jgi:hypothetical protein
MSVLFPQQWVPEIAILIASGLLHPLAREP